MHLKNAQIGGEEDGPPSGRDPLLKRYGLSLASWPVDQLDTRVGLRAIGGRHRENETAESGVDWVPQENWALADMYTWILPVIPIGLSGAKGGPGRATAAQTESQSAHLRKLIKSSGIYALSSVAIPLVSLGLSPFLTHRLSLSDYGALTIINTTISLMVGMTQLGLSSAFFRSYSYDYTSPRDRRAVVATVTALLCLISVPTVVVIALTSPFLAGLLLGRQALGTDISLAGGVVLLQNLTVPGLAWLRAESRPFLYSVLSIMNLLVTLLATLAMVGILHWGVPGAIIANGVGYAFIVAVTIPIIIFKAGVKIRLDVAKGLLAFGLPLVVNFVSYWVLQLSDRYLLSRFASLSATAQYAVVYMLGSAMAVVVTGPFNLAWPTAMFAIAKRQDAAQVFARVFRVFGLFLLFAAFGLSLAANVLLDLLFPAAYRSAAAIIPVVAVSIALYGVYFVFMAGANIKRKTWLAAVFTTLAAVVNVAVNLVLIPSYGAMGAAASTLVAYVVLALAAYIANRLIYPVPFEIGRFIVALFIGVLLYVGSASLARAQSTYVSWGISIGALCLYGGLLASLLKIPALRGRPGSSTYIA